MIKEILERIKIMDEDCKYLKIEDVIGCDIYDHPTYKFYCTKKNKEVFRLMCYRCKEYTTEDK